MTIDHDGWLMGKQAANMRLAVWHYSVRFLQEARALFSKVGRATCRGDPTSVRVFVQILASVTGLAKFHIFPYVL